MFSDAHCHLDGCPEERLPEVVQRCRQAGLELIITTGLSLESSARSVEIARAHDIIYAAVGIHPWEAVPLSFADEQRLKELAAKPKVVAISEIGLDWVRGVEPKEVQIDAFSKQLQVARTVGLPVMIHCREAYEEMMQMLSGIGPQNIRGAIHGFDGDAAMLRGWLDFGFYVSIGRRLLRPEGEALIEVVKQIPEDRLLTETDSNAQTPDAPGPEAVCQVIDRLAQLRGTTPEALAATATSNLRRLLRLEV